MYLYHLKWLQHHSLLMQIQGGGTTCPDTAGDLLAMLNL
jgi:hypothetical protein